MDVLAIFLIWIILSIAAGAVASGKGRSFFGYFFIALLISPLFGLIIAAVLSPIEKNIEAKKLADNEHVKCPFCAEVIKAEATVCRYCGKDLPTPEPPGEGMLTIHQYVEKTGRGFPAVRDDLENGVLPGRKYQGQWYVQDSA